MVQAALDAIAKLNNMEVGAKRIQVHHTRYDFTQNLFFSSISRSPSLHLSLWQTLFTEHSNTRRPVWPVVYFSHTTMLRLAVRFACAKTARIPRMQMVAASV